jgi:hypothetical protein
MYISMCSKLVAVTEAKVIKTGIHLKMLRISTTKINDMYVQFMVYLTSASVTGNIYCRPVYQLNSKL